MKEALRKLSRNQIDFICEECSITEKELNEMDEDSLYDEVYEKMCDIEAEEIPITDDEEESPRCILASGVVTILGNVLAEENGIC